MEHKLNIRVHIFMIYDWLIGYQDFDFELPLIADRASISIDTQTGEIIGRARQPTLKHAGSYSTSLQIRISGNRLTVDGNPSRINRVDNLFGYTSTDQCVSVYNEILTSLGLPSFTKCTKVWLGQGDDGSKVQTYSDGMVFTEVHLTTNKSVGQNNVDDYLRGLSIVPYRNSIPRLHSNGKTCDWLSKSGKGGSLIYPSVYNKGFELELHALPKIKRKFGLESAEYKYLSDVINYCNENGVARFEQKLKSAFLRREKLNHYGFFDEFKFRKIHEQFLNIDKKLQVEAMDLETISTRLIREGVCENTRSANTTTLYAVQWMHGHQFDLQKKQVQTHRARLRKIGIDIALTCDLSRFSLVNVKSSRLVEVKNLLVPDWYQRPKNFLQAVA